MVEDPVFASTEDEDTQVEKTWALLDHGGASAAARDRVAVSEPPEQVFLRSIGVDCGPGRAGRFVLFG